MTNAGRILEFSLIDAIHLDLSNYSESEDTQIYIPRFGQTNITSFKNIQKDTLARWAVGRYEIEEAAEFISKNGDVDFKSIHQKLVSAVQRRVLKTYPAGQLIIGDEKNSCLSDEVYWDDINQWLDENENRITWRFEKPSHASQPKQMAINALPISLADSSSGVIKASINKTEMWIAEAREQGSIYMEAWRKAGHEPTIENIGLYVEGVLLNNGIYNTRGNVIDRATIVREALTGITKRGKGNKSITPNIPEGKARKLPEN